MKNSVLHGRLKFNLNNLKMIEGTINLIKLIHLERAFFDVCSSKSERRLPTANQNVNDKFVPLLILNSGKVFVFDVQSY